MPDLRVPWPEMEEETGEDIADAPDTNSAEAGGERTYSSGVEGLEGVDAEGLLAQFDELSTLEENRDDPANAAQIDRRAREDAELLAELLRAYGYYDALVRTRVEATETAGRIAVTLEVEPGPQYHFADVRLPGIEAAGEDAAALREAFGVEEGAPVNAAQVTAGEAALNLELGRRGYAFAEVGERDIIVDHDTRTATLVLPVEPRGERQFGRIIVEGQPLFSARHIERIARFEPGDDFEAPLLDDLRRALIATGLVSAVTIRPIDDPGSRTVDIAVGLEPAPMRTVAGAAGYGTGEGARFERSWRYRNFIQPQGAATFRVAAGPIDTPVRSERRRGGKRVGVS